MRRNVTPVVPPSMYRHFAVVTVLLTVGLAIVAEGENRQAQAAPTAQAAPARVEATIAVANRATPEMPGWWEADSLADGDTGGSGGGLAGSGSGSMSDLGDVPGYSPEYLASLDDEERELLISGLQDSGMLDPDMREERSTALIAASSRRSGSASSGE